jgi:hypothetical protein
LPTESLEFLRGEWPLFLHDRSVSYFVFSSPLGFWDTFFGLYTILYRETSEPEDLAYTAPFLFNNLRRVNTRRRFDSDPRLQQNHH